MKSAVKNTNDEIEVIEEPGHPWGRIRVCESQGGMGQAKCSIFLTPEQLFLHARDCIALAIKIKRRVVDEEVAKAADEVLPGLGKLVREGKLVLDELTGALVPPSVRPDLPKVLTFEQLEIGACFIFRQQLTGWSPGKLVKVNQAPGWAMPEGWDFVLASETRCAKFEVILLTEQAPQPSGPSIPK